MKSRCFNPKLTCFSDYGGRGITVCDAWRHSFETFYRDMGPCPPTYTIDRINNDGNYEPGNCRWIPRAAQNRNTRKVILIEYNGETRSMSQWAKLYGLTSPALSYRLSRGWSMEQALKTPPMNKPPK